MTGQQPARLTETDIGAWIVQGNPRTWDYFDSCKDDGLSPGDTRDNGWTLHSSYRVALMKPDDLVILWLTDIPRRDYWPGVYEIGQLTSEASKNFGMNPDYILDKTYVPHAGHAVDFRSYILPSPLRSVDLRSDPQLANCEKFRVPMLGNPLYLTPLETVALSSHLPASQLKKAGWDKVLKRAYYTKATR